MSNHLKKFKLFIKEDYAARCISAKRSFKILIKDLKSDAKKRRISSKYLKTRRIFYLFKYMNRRGLIQSHISTDNLESPKISFHHKNSFNSTFQISSFTSLALTNIIFVFKNDDGQAISCIFLFSSNVANLFHS